MSKEMIVKLNSDRVKLNGCEYVQDLVRCGECEYWYINNDLPVEENEICPLGTDANDFCSYGERR